MAAEFSSFVTAVDLELAVGVVWRDGVNCLAAGLSGATGTVASAQNQLVDLMEIVQSPADACHHPSRTTSIARCCDDKLNPPWEPRSEW